MFSNFNSINFDDKWLALKENSVKIIVGILLLIGLIMIITSVSNSRYESKKYDILEEKIIAKMQEHISTNTFELDEGDFLYVDLYTLDLTPDSKLNCSMASGVLVSLQSNVLTYDPYLICQDYISELNKFASMPSSENYITLKGTNPMIIKDEYEEPGYNLTSSYKVETDGKVGTGPGLYVINYNVYKDNQFLTTVKRVVIVGDYQQADVVNNPYPTITLAGEARMNIALGTSYQDPGYSAYDASEGEITSKVTVYGSVDANRVGEYILTYKVISKSGRLADARRVVTVVGDQTPLKIKLNPSTTTSTNKEIVINGQVEGNNYAYVVLPNYSKIYAKQFAYPVKNNGTYTFTFYDNNYNYRKETVTINNIYKERPVVKCTNTIKDGQSIINVTAAAIGVAIEGYSYSNGSSSYTDYIKENTYTFANSNINAFVKVKDIAGNITSIVCLADQSTVKKDTPVTFSMDEVKTKSQKVPCGYDPTPYDNELKTKIEAIGLKTRWAVVQAGVYLTHDFPYKIEYFWGGKYSKIGHSPKWGCQATIPDSGTPRQPGGSKWPFGIDCSGFVKWAFVNAGFDEATIPRTKFHEYKWGDWDSAVYSFKQLADNQQLYDSVKPGDVLVMPGHYALILGVDDTKIKYGQSAGGKAGSVNVRFLDRKTGKGLNGSTSFTHVVLMDGYFEKYGV